MVCLFLFNQRLPIPARIAVATLYYACLEPDAMALGFPGHPGRTPHLGIDNEKDTPFGVSLLLNQRILMYPSFLSYTGCSSLWVLLPKTLRDELRDSLQFILRFAPISWVLCGPSWVLCGPSRPYI